MKNKSFIIICTITILASIISIYLSKSNKESNKSIYKKSVVVYFSVTHNTEKVAKKIAKLSDSDLIEIIPAQPYTDEDIDFTSTTNRSYKEQHNKQDRPLISNEIDLSKYNKIYLGYPIWWGTNPKIILTFIDQNDLSNKEIIPFCTSGGTDINTSVEELRRFFIIFNYLFITKFFYYFSVSFFIYFKYYNFSLFIHIIIYFAYLT